MLRRLYATPPPEFVATRNGLVKELRRDKRRDEAAALAALRRPGWEDWSLNAVASADADAVAGFAAAAGDVREAQSAAIEGRDGPDIRTALRELREASAELVRRAEAELVRAGRQPATGEVNARLSQIAGNDVAVAQLQAGILGSGDTAPRDLFGDVELVEAPARARPGRAASKRSGPRPSARSGDPAADERPRGDDAAAERAARAEERRREEALAAAEREHRAAVEARDRAAAEVEDAEATAARARAALAAAEEALASAQGALADAAGAADAAATALEDARAALA